MKKYMLSAWMLCAALASCDTDAFFELDRPEVTPWQNVNDFEYMVVSPYTAHFQMQGWGSPMATIAFYGEWAADLTFANPWSIEQEAVYWYPRQMSTYDPTGSNTEMVFKILYGALGTCNTPITFVEDKENAGQEVFDYMTDADRETLKRQKGELYFMRAYTYWMISRIFMPPYNETNAQKRFVPLITKLNQTQEALRNPYMGTVEEVYRQMVDDLKKAKDLLPETNTRGRANKYAASALLTRVYWFMGNNTEALNECNFIISDAVDNKGYYDLSEEPIRAFNRNAEAQYTANPVAKEVIWEAVITAEGTNQPIAFCRMSKAGGYNFNSKAGTYTPDNATWTGGLRGDNYQHGQWACAYWNPRIIKYIGWADTDDPTDLTNYVPNNEARNDKRFTQLHAFLKANNGDEGADKEEYEQTFPHIKWNVFWNDKYFRAPYARYTNVPIIRLPEIYLTRASLLVSTNPGQAASDVNKVRERAGLTPLPSVTEEDIEKERIKELGFEETDRLTYLVAMEKSLDGGKKSLSGIDLNSDSNNPMTGTDVPAINPPYSELYVPLPSIEYLYSNSTPDID